MKIFITAGHGGKDPGACGTFSQEKNLTLAMALKLGKRLEDHGIVIVYNRIDDTYVEFTKVGDTADLTGADYYISIHCNSATDKSAKGTETFAFAAGGQGEQLARFIQAELIKIDGVVDRGVKFANFAELRTSDMPAVLVETMFISNDAEEKKLNNPAQQDNIVEAITKGTCASLNIEYKEVEQEMAKREYLNCDQILELKTDDAQKWKDAIQTAVNAAKADGNLGALEIFEYLPTLLEKAYND